MAYKYSGQGGKDEIRPKMSNLQQCALRFIDTENALEVGVQNFKKLNNSINSPLSSGGERH